MINGNNYQWYPGHMTKARRQMQEDIKLVDLVIELADARIPLSSRNPDIDQLAGGKARVLLLNKADLSSDSANAAWKKYFESKGIFTTTLDARGRQGARKVMPLIAEAGKEKKERDRKRGILNRPLRAMIVGIPNVGKSTFINSFAGKAAAKTGNKPGVTRGKQWIRLNKEVELLDTPGILWPKFEDQQVGKKLALIGSIRDELLDQQELSVYALEFIHAHYAGFIQERYGIEESEQVLEMIEAIAKARGALGKNGEFDFDKAAAYIIDDLRSGRLGKISLEFPPATV